jgi:hypothetical protein
MPAKHSVYRVAYETREPGAIGIFEPRTFDVIASDPIEAGRLALDKVHEANLEGRFPLSVVKMSNLYRS